MQTGSRRTVAQSQPQSLKVVKSTSTHHMFVCASGGGETAVRLPGSGRGVQHVAFLSCFVAS